MKKLWRNEMVQTIPKLPESVETSICEVCMEGKQSRIPFGESTGTRSSRPLELIHTDVGGPYTPATWDRKRFFVTFIDD